MNVAITKTDLACERVSLKTAGPGVELEELKLFGLSASRIKIDESGGALIGKPQGSYYTLFCSMENEADEANALGEILSALVPREGRVLVAGLGNEHITPDSLGARTVRRVAATGHFSAMEEFGELQMREVYVVETGVLAQTGIESSRQLGFIAEGIKPEVIVAIDSLACTEPERLGKTIQVTDTGIAPGSGVKNFRQEMTEKTFGVPVVAIGVPTVMGMEAVGAGGFDAMIVPRDIDLTMRYYARVISSALNGVLNPALSQSEIEQLLF